MNSVQNEALDHNATDDTIAIWQL